MQLLTRNNEIYVIYSRFGRVGQVGQMNTELFIDKDQAIAEYQQLFYKKMIIIYILYA